MGRFFYIVWMLILVALAGANPTLTVPVRDEGFSAGSLRSSPSFFLLDPSRFGMQQSYSMNYVSSSAGSFSSGVYLNTISYQFGIPLTLSMDVGMYNMFHQDWDGSRYGYRNEEKTGPQFILPRIGLEYRPTDKMTFSLQLIQVNDAYKAYGYGPWGYYGYGARSFRRSAD